MTSPALLAPSIQLSGLDLSADQLSRLTSLQIQRGLRLSARAVLRFDDHGYVLSTQSTFAVGTNLKVKTANGSVLFDGAVTGVSLEQSQFRWILNVTADEAAVKLTMGNKVTTYLASTATDIVQKIGSEVGMTVDADSSSEQLPYTFQTGSHFDLLNDLADRVGFDWWAEGRKLFFKKPVAGKPVNLVYTENLTAFSVKATALHPNATKVYGWDTDQKQSIVGQAPTTGSLKPDSVLISGFVDSTEISGSVSMIVSEESPNSATEAEAIASSRSQQWVSGAVTARGVAQANANITPGGSISVTQAGPASGTYHVTEVNHVYTPDGFETKFVAGNRQSTSIVDSLAPGPGSNFYHTGLLIGVVTQIASGSGNDGRKGDVKVMFPTLAAGLESHWARIATVGGGPSRGITFMPEIDDEVIVGFENGDVRRPVILGGLFNGKDMATEYGVNGGKIFSRRMTSRNGTFMEMKDGESSSDDMFKVDLRGAGTHSIIVDDASFKVKIPANKDFSILSGDMGITFSGGTLTLKASKIVLDAQNDLELKGTNIKAKALAAVEASGAQVSIKATGTGEVSASGPLTLKGAIVQIN